MAATVHERIAAARQALIGAGLSAEDAAIDAAVLARHALGWDRASLLARGRESAPPAFDEVYAQLIRRRTAREPVALITGSREFWGLDFRVSSGVIVPRPETELVVEQALACARDAGSRRLVDVGTGSGCLAVALASELPGARVLAIDTSLEALRVAARNARRHGVADRVHLVQATLLEAVGAPVDLIVSNPPYVPDTETLPPEVARYEPPEALFAGPDGLDVLRALISSAPARLAPGGRFIVEFGFGQRAAVESLARAAGWSRVGFVNDLQDIPRVAVMEH
ncbi:MAG TPA: peptide chain release factor N(5)-glutamine methyltransferase [Vicinamibacterales bacterium]|nr:peptide chain release factor N(5)-glutamine methyltransferase [Vicinamibacterales bacterium]